MIRAKCDLSIELDQPERRYRPGDPITGLVRVQVGGETKCDGLTITQQWRTHGRGNRASGPALPVELFRGPWQPGTYTYPFRLECPREPASYHGEVLNVDWYLDARADVPWAIDAKASTDFFVDYGADASYELLVHGAEEALSQASAVFLLFLLPFWGAGFFVLYLGVTETPVALIGGGAWLLFVGFLTYLVVKKRVAKAAFSRFAPEVSGGVDGPLVVELGYATQRRVNAVEAKLVAEEVVVSGSGTNQTTYREIAYELGERKVVGSIGQRSLSFTFDVPHPSTVGYSFEASDNQLRWYVSFDCDIEGWPDLEQRVELELRPRSGSGEDPYRSSPATPASLGR